MQYLTPSNVLIGLIWLCAILGIFAMLWRIFMTDRPRPPINAAGWLRGLTRVIGESTNLADIPDDEVLMEIDVPEPDSEKAVDLNESDPFGPVTFEVADMTLRLTKPHLFAANWYEQSRRDFSIWAVEMAQKRARYRRRMGLAT